MVIKKRCSQNIDNQFIKFCYRNEAAIADALLLGN